MFGIFVVIVVLYAVVCGLLFFFQEKIIFLPEKLDKTFRFNFQGKFTELNIPSTDGLLLNGLLFKANASKGLIFYLHGNAGSLRSWGDVAEIYTDLGYDIFILDYRGYGKSEGYIGSESQMFNDVQAAYDKLKQAYSEDKIVLLGYSIGTGPAAYLASVNHPRLLILQAPYYNLTDMMKHTFSFIPTFLLKYKFETNVYLKSCRMPVVIFHGDQDNVIYHASSLKLETEFKDIDKLFTLNGLGHNGMTHDPEYQRILQNVLMK